MGINLTNFLSSRSKNRKMIDFQDLDHLDGLSISAINANLYQNIRDDLVMFYFRKGANFASVYTQSKIVSENIKWNLNHKTKKIFSLLVNTRNANAFTGDQGYKSLGNIAEILSKKLSEKQKEDEDHPEKIKMNNIIFGCTGTIGEKFPEEKIKNKITDLVNNIKYTQNKYIWIKAALGIMTTDTQPKLAMEECKIGNTPIKIYGIAKGSGMIQPNMATTLGYIFTDADIPFFASTIPCCIAKIVTLKSLENLFKFSPMVLNISLILSAFDIRNIINAPIAILVMKLVAISKGPFAAFLTPLPIFPSAPPPFFSNFASFFLFFSSSFCFCNNFNSSFFCSD